MVASTETETLLDLRGYPRLRRGKQRNIYLLRPDASGNATGMAMVLKVPRYGERLERLPVAKRLLRRIYPNSEFRVLNQEVNYWNKLVSRKGSAGDKLPIPAFVGFVNTTEGRGVLWEAMLDARGELGPNLLDICRSGKPETAIEPLNRFVEICLSESIVAPDLNAKNLVLACKNGRQDFFLVDGFSDHRMISLREISPRYNARFLMERFAKIARRMGLEFNPAEQRFRLPDGPYGGPRPDG